MKWLLVGLLMGLGCSDAGDNAEPGGADSGPQGADAREVQGTYGGEREPDVYLPTDHNLAESWPMVLLLHGYTANSLWIENYLGVGARVDQYGYVAVVPNGTADQQGAQFWNASSACCDFYGSNVDDVGYLRNLIEDAVVRFGVDPERVYILGHSNGGFMAYRMACDASDVVAGIVSISGLTQNSPARCTAGEPVNVLHVHGTADTTIPFAGNATTPGAIETTRRWRARNGCAESTTSGTDRDVVANIAGAETAVSRSQACQGGGNVELWTIVDAPHVPSFSSDFTDQALQFHGF